MLVPDPGAKITGDGGPHYSIIGHPRRGKRNDPRRVGQRVDKAHPRHIPACPEIRRYHALAIRELTAPPVAASEAKPDIVLAQRTGDAGERVNVTADRAAIADKRLVETLTIIEGLAADYATHLQMAPRLVDAGGRNPLRHRVLQWAEKRHIAEAGHIGLEPGRDTVSASGGVWDLVDVDVSLPERPREISNRVLEPGGKHCAVGTLIGVFDLRRARPAG